MKYEVSIPIFFQLSDWLCKNNPNVSITTIDKWLHLEFGMINRNWEWEWLSIAVDDDRHRDRRCANVVVFKFETEEDRVKFILRWA